MREDKKFNVLLPSINTCCSRSQLSFNSFFLYFFNIKRACKSSTSLHRLGNSIWYNEVNGLGIFCVVTFFCSVGRMLDHDAMEKQQDVKNRKKYTGKKLVQHFFCVRFRFSRDYTVFSWILVHYIDWILFWFPFKLVLTLRWKFKQF